MEWIKKQYISFLILMEFIQRESIQCLKDNNYLAAVTGDAGYNTF